MFSIMFERNPKYKDFLKFSMYFVMYIYDSNFHIPNDRFSFIYTLCNILNSNIN